MESEISFRQAIQMCRAVYWRFEQAEGRAWGVEGAMIELVKQVGELAKQIMLAEKYYFQGRAPLRGYETDKEIIANELADIFGMIIRIADYYEIDLVEAHIKARRDEEESLMRMGV